MSGANTNGFMDYLRNIRWGDAGIAAVGSTLLTWAYNMATQPAEGETRGFLGNLIHGVVGLALTIGSFVGIYSANPANAVSNLMDRDSDLRQGLQEALEGTNQSVQQAIEAAGDLTDQTLNAIDVLDGTRDGQFNLQDVTLEDIQAAITANQPNADAERTP